MSQSIEQVRAFWDAFSTTYQSNLERYMYGTYPTLVEYLRIGSPKRVLEVGCGPGLGAVHLMRTFDSAVEIVCSDLSPEMCELAKASVARLQSQTTGDVELPSVSVQVENGEELSFPDKSFDRYVSNMCIMLAPDTEKFLRECRRVLTDDGVAVFSTWGRKELSPGFNFANLAPKYAKMVEENKSGGVAPPKDPNAKPSRSNYHLGDEQKFQALLKGAGFSRVRTWYFQSHFAVLSGEQYADQCFNSLPFKKFKAHLTDEQSKQAHAELAAGAQAEIDAGRPVVVDVLCAVVQP